MSKRAKTPEAPPPARYGQRLALAGSALLVAPGLAAPYFGVKTLALAAGLAWAWLALPRARKAPLAVPAAALLAAAAVSAFFSADRYQSFYGDWRQPFYGLLQLGLYALAYFLGASADEALAEDGLRTLAWTGAACAALCAVQLTGALPPRWSVMDGRLIGPSGNPAFFGALAALVWPVCLARAGRGGAARAAVWALPVAIALTFTRGAWLAAAAGGAAWAAASGRVKPRAWWAAAAFAALAAVLLAGRLMGRGHSDVVRRELWKTGARAAAERPFTGYGPDTYMLSLRKLKSEAYVRALGAQQEQSSAHNDVIEAAATMGAPGLLAYLWLLGALALALRRGLQEGSERAAACAGALAAAFVVTKFNPVTPEFCAAAAWLAGAAGPRREEASRGAKAGGALAAVLLAAAVALVFVSDQTLAAAKRALYEGRLDDALWGSDRAVSLAPGRLPAELGRCEILVQAAQRGGAQAPALAERALEGGRLAARRHPENPQARELSGTVAFFGGLALRRPELLREALAELGEASRLDPWHPYAVERRAQVARALGDAAEAARADEELARLRAAGALRD